MKLRYSLLADLDSGVLDHLCPLRRLRRDNGRKFRRRVGDDLHAELIQSLAHLARGQDPAVSRRACR